MLGYLFLFACVIAAAAIAGILFVVIGPVPVKRRVMRVSRVSAARVAPAEPSLVAKLASVRPGEEFFTPPRPMQVVTDEPIPATAAQVPSLRPPRGGKVQPLPKKRSAKGTDSPHPFAPVVRSGHRQMREEDVATNPVRRARMPLDTFDTGELTTVDQ